ncbi:hypothetical protein KSC_020710 [Ktedonobacter sp. SOSP1-52]|nr:hypothetical protein KSC_020710 [Ktedonobacter sp. SOSP1-52]
MRECVFLREREACVEEEQLRDWLVLETWFPVSWIAWREEGWHDSSRRSGGQVLLWRWGEEAKRSEEKWQPVANERMERRGMAREAHGCRVVGCCYRDEDLRERGDVVTVTR